MTDATVRDAQPADAAELVRLDAVLLDSLGSVDEDGWQHVATSSLTASLTDGSVIGAVTTIDGHVVSGAMAAIWHTIPGPGHDGRRAWIFGVATDPSHRRRGHARATLSLLLDRLDKMDIRKIDLSSTSEGEGVYRSLGFAAAPFPRLVRRPPGL